MSGVLAFQFYNWHFFFAELAPVSPSGAFTR